MSSILLLGSGKMGGALLRGWLAHGVAAGDVVVVEPATEAAAGVAALGVRVVRAVAELPVGFLPAVAVLAVKPQILGEAVRPLLPLMGPGAVVLSIAAGKTMADLAALLGPDTPVVRAMPNLPASVGRGMQVAVANANVVAAMRRRCETLLGAVGDVAWIEDESLMDAVTAVSGSGPAYVFLLIECLAEAGVAAGLPIALATQLARATVTGAGELAFQARKPAADLRREVTSPGGTTEAALRVLMADDGLKPLMCRAVQAAAARSRELAG
jgi:pyrroline-5-carboxylate reductase